MRRKVDIPSCERFDVLCAFTVQNCFTQASALLIVLRFKRWGAMTRVSAVMRSRVNFAF